MMYKFSKILAVAAALSMPASAFAQTVATLSNASGKVLVNQGKGYVPVTFDMVLKAGDHVMTGAEGTVEINYAAANCHVTVNAKSVVVIKAKPTCTAGESVAQLEATMISPVKGYITPALPPELLIVGGLGFTAGVLALTTDIFKKKCAAGASVC